MVSFFTGARVKVGGFWNHCMLYVPLIFSSSLSVTFKASLGISGYGTPQLPSRQQLTHLGNSVDDNWIIPLSCVL